MTQKGAYQLIVNLLKTGGESLNLADVLAGSSTISGAVVNVTTAGSRVQLPDIDCREVTVIAKRTNTGSIYVGGVNVSSSIYGAELRPRDSITLSLSNANMIYIDAAVNGEGISYVAI